ncbi:Coronin-like protein crn1 [Gonapodya sp. JEL0774]|nr:Coronin-like protein crn1 [Gonapodya sp. JEL0774]
MSRFVRPSKFRHVFANPAKKPDGVFDNMKVSKNAWDTNLVSANAHFIAVNLEAGGGGTFSVLPLDAFGKQPDSLPLVAGHGAAVLDTDWNPFNDWVVASGAEDCKAMIWKIPEGGLTETLTTPAATLSGHGRKVGHVLFHPLASSVLLTSSPDLTLKLWDISQAQERSTVAVHPDVIQSVCWSGDGKVVATACKDKTIRIVDPRGGKVAVEAASHQGTKGSRVVWMGDTTKILSTGFSRQSDRQVYVWDQRQMAKPIKEENIDTSSGTLIPYYDADTKMVYLAGKGDGNIRYYEWDDEASNLFYLSEYKSNDSLRGICFIPKRAVKVADCEIARAYKAHTGMVEPLSFVVPRKADTFQADLYPDTLSDVPSLTSDKWFAGKDAPATKISLANGFVATVPKEFTVSAAAQQVSHEQELSSSGGKPAMTEKDYQDAYHALRKENEKLRNELEQSKVRVRQLEAQLDKNQHHAQ